jgi:hypothetical protein
MPQRCRKPSRLLANGSSNTRRFFAMKVARSGTTLPMRLLACAVLLAASTAEAQVCSVEIPRAPDDVRIEIETWVRAEPRCSVELEIRVVPTEGGYYLLARDRQGRVRERIVPNAQSAGVLVASWVADDSVIQELDVPPPSQQLAPRQADRYELMPPGAVAPMPHASRSRWVTVGGLAQLGDQARGLRIDADVATYGNWTLGAELIGATTTKELLDVSPTSGTWEYGFMHTRDIQLLASVSHTSTFGRWHLRIGAGIGATHTSVTGQFDIDAIAGSGWFPGGELSLALDREIGTSWAFAFGPTVTAYSQTLQTTNPDMTFPLERHETQVLAFAGLRHRL